MRIANTIQKISNNVDRDFNSFRSVILLHTAVKGTVDFKLPDKETVRLYLTGKKVQSVFFSQQFKDLTVN